MSQNVAAKVVDTLGVMQELFMFMGANEAEAIKAIPMTMEEAAQLGRTLPSQPWFRSEDYSGGGMFPINDALLDLRHSGGESWQLACTIIDNMPRPQACDDYALLVLNMRAIRDEKEIPGKEGLEIGLKVWPHPATRSQATEA